MRKEDEGAEAKPPDVFRIRKNGQHMPSIVGTPEPQSKPIAVDKGISRNAVQDCMQDKRAGVESDNFADTVTASFQKSGLAKEYLPATLREFRNKTQLRALDKPPRKSVLDITEVLESSLLLEKYCKYMASRRSPFLSLRQNEIQVQQGAMGRKDAASGR